MSIFGKKPQHQRNDDFEKSVSSFKMYIQNLYNRLDSDLEQKISELVSSSNIFDHVKSLIRDISISNRLLYNEIDQLKDKSVFTIFAESKGTILKNEIFSFGNGCRELDIGYCIMRRCQILGIALASKRQSGPVGVGISVNGRMLPSCEITLHTSPRKHDNFDTEFIVEAGSYINFVATIENKTTTCSVASLLMKLI